MHLCLLKTKRNEPQQKTTTSSFKRKNLLLSFRPTCTHSQGYQITYPLQYARAASNMVTYFLLFSSSPCEVSWQLYHFYHLIYNKYCSILCHCAANHLCVIPMGNRENKMDPTSLN